uniref:Nocturnin a n=1 Tax=Oncorhynchus tshawytscha TaxID=74940 RepID=A0A8C8FME8_ONCTS
LRECEDALQNRPAQRELQAPCSTTEPNWSLLTALSSQRRYGFARCPLEALIWAERKYLEQILSYRPDILCLQEVDHYYDTFQPILAGSTLLPKPWSPCLDVASNNSPDICALFYRRSCFSLLHTSHLHLSSMMLPTNQVAVVQTLCQRLCMAMTHLKAGVREGQTLEVPLIVSLTLKPSEDMYRLFISSTLGLDSAYKLLCADGQTEPVCNYLKAIQCQQALIETRCFTQRPSLYYVFDLKKGFSIYNLRLARCLSSNELLKSMYTKSLFLSCLPGFLIRRSLQLQFED